MRSRPLVVALGAGLAACVTVMVIGVAAGSDVSPLSLLVVGAFLGLVVTTIALIVLWAVEVIVTRRSQ